MITFDKSFYTIWLLISRDGGGGRSVCCLAGGKHVEWQQLLNDPDSFRGRAAAFYSDGHLIMLWNTLRYFVSFFRSFSPYLGSSALCSDNESFDFWLDSISGDPSEASEEE